MDDHELTRRIHDAVSGSAPDSARLWEAVMDDATHARKVRNARRTALALVVIAFGIGTPVAINLANRDTGNFAGPTPSDSPSASPSASPTWGVPPVPFVHPRMNVVVDIPRGYEKGEFEGHVDIRPGFLPGPVEGGDTAWFEMFPDVVDPREGEPNDTIGGHDAWMTETLQKSGGRRVAWVVEWPTGLSTPGGAAENGFITISIAASTDSLWNDYEDELRGIVASVREPGDIESAQDPLTRFGTLAAGSWTLDDLALTAIAFADDRMYCSMPEMWLTAEARDQYADLGERPDGGPWLGCEGEGFLETYGIVERRDADANSAEFDLVFTLVVPTQNGEERWSLAETIGIGAGENGEGDRLDAVVRFVDANAKPLGTIPTDAPPEPTN